MSGTDRTVTTRAGAKRMTLGEVKAFVKEMDEAGAADSTGVDARANFGGGLSQVRRLMSDCDPCPSCGIPWDMLPVGHDLITPVDGSPQTCEVLRGVSPLEYARDFPPGPQFGTCVVMPAEPFPVTGKPQEIPEAFRRKPVS